MTLRNGTCWKMDDLSLETALGFSEYLPGLNAAPCWPLHMGGMGRLDILEGYHLP